MNIYHLLFRYMDFFAAGDAVGKATEFMLQSEIRKDIGRISGLIPSSKSKNHSDLSSWDVTDDTEQNLYLLRRYIKDGIVSVENTVDALVDWIDSTGAVEKKYIGPSSLKALNSIKEGADASTAGIFGTTCGGIMRSPSAVFASRILSIPLDDAVYMALMPTHNNSVALESAYAYAYALDAAIDGATGEEVLIQAKKGCRIGLQKAPFENASATLLARLEFFEKISVANMEEDEFLSFLYSVMGTGLASYETAGAVFAILMRLKDPVKAIFLSSELGGDTDTIAALASGLISMVDRDSILPGQIIEPIREHIDLGIV